MDFMSDLLDDGRSLRTFNVIDDLNPEALGIEWPGKPGAIRCDNGPEYVSHQLIDWANERHITLLYIQSGKPTQNAYIERFNRTGRHE